MQKLSVKNEFSVSDNMNRRLTYVELELHESRNSCKSRKTYIPECLLPDLSALHNIAVPICGVIKQNQSEVGQIQFSFF